MTYYRCSPYSSSLEGGNQGEGQKIVPKASLDARSIRVLMNSLLISRL